MFLYVFGVRFSLFQLQQLSTIDGFRNLSTYSSAVQLFPMVFGPKWFSGMKICGSKLMAGFHVPGYYYCIDYKV